MHTGHATRLVALGASNLARMVLALLDARRADHGGPVECHAALGRGRSYGLPSRLLGRGLGGILASPLWREPHGARATTTALLMDVGNDLLYGVPVPRIVEWFTAANERLDAIAARRVVIGLPVAAIRRLPRWRFLLVRSVLVPSSRLTLAQAVDGAEALHTALAQLAARTGAAFGELAPEWYGLDPIHVRRRHVAAAARAWLGGSASPASAPRCDTALQRARLLGCAPAERTWFGQRTTAAQPAMRFVDGSSLHLW